ncbi:MAG TPA: hypothetical protein VFS22_04245 [Flavisolibacter sp.]|nr:hypothetical protein [Flavisolibacter sp.]
MKNTKFYFHWISFILGFVFGVFGVLVTLFARNERRDRFIPLCLVALSVPLSAFFY